MPTAVRARYVFEAMHVSREQWILIRVHSSANNRKPVTRIAGGTSSATGFGRMTFLSRDVQSAFGVMHDALTVFVPFIIPLRYAGLEASPESGSIESAHDDL